MKKLNVLIPDGDGEKAIRVVQSLGVTGKTKVFILTTPENKVRFSRFCTPFLLSKDFGYGEMDYKVQYVLNKFPIDVILPFAEKGISYIHENPWLRKWRLSPLPEINSMETVGDKWKLHCTLQRLQLDTPGAILISDLSDMEKLLEISKYPVLIKPTKGVGGFGITLANDFNELHSELLKKFTTRKDKQYIIQEYISGYDVDISILCKKGEILAYTIQKPIQKAKNSFTFAKMIQFVKDSNVLEYCQKLVSSLEWSGVGHLDLLREKSGGKLHLIDFNPRFWGTLLGSTCSGVNFPYLACLAGMGISYPPPNYKQIDYFELERKQMPSFIFSNKRNKLAAIKNSTIYLSLLDPMPTLMRAPGLLR